MEDRQQDGDVDAVARIELPNRPLELREDQIEPSRFLFVKVVRHVELPVSAGPDVCEDDTLLVLEGVQDPLDSPTVPWYPGQMRSMWTGLGPGWRRP